MSVLVAFGSGLVGAATLTAIHESARQNMADAPRMDLLGEEAIGQTLTYFSQDTPDKDRLHQAALVGDVLANSLYYSLVAVGSPKTAMLRGALLGLAAGVGGVLLPKPLGLSPGHSSRTAATQAMTVGWYVAGGLAAAAAYQLLAKRR